MANNVIELIIRANDRASGPITGVIGRINALSKSVLGIGLSGVGFGIAFGAGLRAITHATIEAQKAVAQLDAAYRATGATVGVTREAMDALATSMQETTVNEDELVKSAESILLTFDKVRGQAFERTIRASADLSARLGIDLVSATRSLGLALQSPEQGLLRLRRAGVIFSESQKDIIKGLVQTGQLAEAQNIILSEIERRFAGAAVAARQTLGGALEFLRNKFHDLLEFDAGQTSKIVGAITFIAENLKTLVRVIGSVTVAWVAFKTVAAAASFAKDIGASIASATAGVNQTAQELARRQAVLAGTIATRDRVIAESEGVVSARALAAVNMNVASAERAVTVAITAHTVALAEMTVATRTATGASEGLAVAQTAAATATVAGSAAAEGAVVATTLLQRATVGLMATLRALGLLNPYLWIAVAIGAVTYAVLRDKTITSEAAAERLKTTNEAIADIKRQSGVQSRATGIRLAELERERIALEKILSPSFSGGGPRRGGASPSAQQPLGEDEQKKLESYFPALDQLRIKLDADKAAFAEIQRTFGRGTQEYIDAGKAIAGANRQWLDALAEQDAALRPVLVTAQWDSTLKDWNEKTRTVLENAQHAWADLSSKIKQLKLTPDEALSRLRSAFESTFAGINVTTLAELALFKRMVAEAAAEAGIGAERIAKLIKEKALAIPEIAAGLEVMKSLQSEVEQAALAGAEGQRVLAEMLKTMIDAGITDEEVLASVTDAQKVLAARTAENIKQAKRGFEDLSAAGKKAAEDIQSAFAGAFRSIFEGSSLRGIAENFLRAIAEIPIQAAAKALSEKVTDALLKFLPKKKEKASAAPGAVKTVETAVINIKTAGLTAEEAKIRARQIVRAIEDAAAALEIHIPKATVDKIVLPEAADVTIPQATVGEIVLPKTADVAIPQATVGKIVLPETASVDVPMARVLKIEWPEPLEIIVESARVLEVQLPDVPEIVIPVARIERVEMPNASVPAGDDRVSEQSFDQIIATMRDLSMEQQAAAVENTSEIVAAVEASAEASCECVCSCLASLKDAGGSDAVVGAVLDQTRTAKTTAKTASADVVTGVDNSIKTSTQAITNKLTEVANFLVPKKDTAGSKIFGLIAQFAGAAAGKSGSGDGTKDVVTGSRGHAGGGMASGGRVRVGEEGPEIVDLPKGSRVSNQRQQDFRRDKTPAKSSEINFKPLLLALKSNGMQISKAVTDSSKTISKSVTALDDRPLPVKFAPSAAATLKLAAPKAPVPVKIAAPKIPAPIVRVAMPPAGKAAMQRVAQQIVVKTPTKVMQRLPVPSSSVADKIPARVEVPKLNMPTGEPSSRIQNQKQVASSGGGSKSLSFAPQYNITISGGDNPKEAQQQLFGYLQMQDAKQKKWVVDVLQTNYGRVVTP